MQQVSSMIRNHIAGSGYVVEGDKVSHGLSACVIAPLDLWICASSFSFHSTSSDKIAKTVQNSFLQSDLFTFIKKL